MEGRDKRSMLLLGLSGDSVAQYIHVDSGARTLSHTRKAQMQSVIGRVEKLRISMHKTRQRAGSVG